MRFSGWTVLAAVMVGLSLGAVASPPVSFARAAALGGTCDPRTVDELRAADSAIEAGTSRMSAADQMALYERLSQALYACAMRRSSAAWGPPGENSRNGDLFDSAAYAAAGAVAAHQAHDRDRECRLLRTAAERYRALKSRKPEPQDSGRYPQFAAGAAAGEARARRLIATDCP